MTAVDTPVAPAAAEPRRLETMTVSPAGRLAADVQQVCLGARIFVSMPYLEGVTPRVLKTDPRTGSGGAAGPLERRHGIFRTDEIGLPMFDHGVLYGDACFEGVLAQHGRLFLWREHLVRLHDSARRLGIGMPYDDVELTRFILEAIRETGVGDEERAYVRLVVTRGLGDLGINPAKCIGSTVYAIAARLQMYPEAAYQRGIPIAVARSVRRTGADVLDPQVKSCNYLNNILALVETAGEGCLETMLLTQQGNVAEASADNLFLVERGEGWETDPSRVVVTTPTEAYCLNGITRQTLMRLAEEEGYTVVVSGSMLPGDWAGPGREGFLTGTGAGLMPVTAVGGLPVGDGAGAGPVTRRLRERYLAVMADPSTGVALDASDDEIRRYLSA